MNLYQLLLFVVYIYYINNSLDEIILKKKDKITTSKNYVFYDSSDDSVNDKMHFILESDSYCDNELKYGYYDSLDNINNPLIPYSVSFSSEENTTTEDNKMILKTKYFSIKKQKDELGDLNGNYLLLYFGCAGEANIENGKKKLSTEIILIIIASVLVALLIIGFIVYYFFFCKKKKTTENIDTDKPRFFRSNK